MIKISITLATIFIAVSYGQLSSFADWSLTYTGEGIRLLDGGTGDSELHYLDNIDLQIEIRTDALWSGGTAMIYLLSNTGADPSTFVGDAQVSSNIEAFDSQRLYEFWYNQVLADGRIEILAGLHDLNSEFYTNDCAGLFNNSSFGIGADVASNAPVSVFNLAAPGLRIKYTPTDNISILGAIYDGDPGDPAENDNGLSLDWDKDQGTLSIIESQFNRNYNNNNSELTDTYRFGFWYHSADFVGVNEVVPETHNGNLGVYTSIDKSISETLKTFFAGGIAKENCSPVPYYFGTGINLIGFLESRTDDVLGFALNAANISEYDAWEIVLEASMQVQLLNHFSLKPDLQYIINPGGNPDNDNSMVFSLRAEIGF
ncbi:MAG: carbohydrate porin [Candidatus Marinimicrobia bacterium]|nr:carbohydrate porin [Candidatus Neomarinimicrobiota bacterium]MBT3634517.1 carbohydrate porin [Candidatus Neomarinimicrobiota bacterium]MBT3683414.1 carbohydrate porin [Candidatus Neomarinimicrobiota bacterium]MBT3760302.1 carbohydrate porin [Candidatus Neomarinimicrobiota bacterium]MBT3896397.1 carbohydrate porin [Candidatus Neomarinimicrobiota bacterium]